ncbi:MAG: TIGR00730 family Rossman fold protein [Caldilineaceae bacterium]|nr:TIGR00730 family Rossman fold protein [Caldilineaceae bacterium]HRJ43634.1 TIGR00730 family Rossman fold protein [Caldilineaceae bacterium]
MNQFSHICVYCGASDGVNGAYLAGASVLGAEIARRGYGLVYGGGSVGVMGAVARSVAANGGTVHGVIPTPLLPKEVSGPPIGTLEVVDSMHTRKARMAELADAFIALPGGFGTLEELFETITWTQLGIHRKPIGLLNSAGFYDPLLALIEHSIAQGFVRPKYRSLLVAESDPAVLLDRLAAHEAPDGFVQWMTKEEA